MAIRFYIPLPGPFAWVPGKRHPKPKGDSVASSVGNLLTSLAGNVGQRIYDDAHQHATDNAHPNPNQFATNAVDRARTNFTTAYVIGLLATLVYWFYQMGFGTLLLAIIPVVNLVAIGIPTFIVGTIIAVALNQPAQLFQ